MSASLNRVTLMGNLTKDPEVKSFNNGGKVCNLSLATNKRWKDKDGQQKEAVQYHSVAIFNDGLAGVAEKYLKKGNPVYIEGELETRSYDKDGEKRYVTEVVLRQYSGELKLLGGRGDDATAQCAQSHTKTSGNGPALDDSIEF